MTLGRQTWKGGAPEDQSKGQEWKRLQTVLVVETVSTANVTPYPCAPQSPRDGHLQ